MRESSVPPSPLRSQTPLLTKLCCTIGDLDTKQGVDKQSNSPVEYRNQ